MRPLRPSPSVAALGAVGTLALAALPGTVPLEAQAGPRVADVVSKEIAVGRDEATLRLELAGGEDLEVRFGGGRVHLDGDDLGASDERLEDAWRELLGRAVALDDGPLARALIDWEPPVRSDGDEDVAGLGTRLDRALEEALQVPEDAPSASDPGGSGMAALARLLGRAERLTGLAVALDDLDVDELAVHVEEDVVVGSDEEVDATLLVIDGDADVRGTVREHVVIVGGTLRTYEGSLIEGDVRLADGRLVRDGGTIDGIVRELESALDSELEHRIREAEEQVREAREEARRAREHVRVEAPRDDGFMAPFRSIGRSIGRGVAGILQTLVAFLALGVLGALTVMLGRDNLEVVARTARRSPGRSAAVGLAGAFLTVPAWVLGIVALSITIIGIPVMIAWVPLFPLAVVLAAVMGYFAVAQNAGEWLSRKRYPYLDWVRSSNPYTLVLGGVVGLLAAFFLANVVTLFGPLLGFLRGLLIAAGVVVTVGACLVGFGAVLLTRAGRRPEYWGGGGIDPFGDDGWDWEPRRPPTGPTGESGPAGTGARSGPTGGSSTGTAAREPGPSAPPGGESAERPGGPTGSGGARDDERGSGKASDDAGA